jgi:hypothetical protein
MNGNHMKTINLGQHKLLILTLKILPAIMALFYIIGSSGIGLVP